MRLEASRATFERLIQLYLAVFAVSVGAVVFEGVSPVWGEFGHDFDILAESHFGPRNEQLVTVMLVLGLAALIWHLACAVGLLRYKRWARLGFWASILLLLLTEVAFFPVPAYQTPWFSWLTWVAQALFGAILFLAYVEEHGANWFKRPLDRLKETF